MKLRNEEKFLPGSDYHKIRGLADMMDDEVKIWGNGLIIPAWGKRFTFDQITGDIIKVQQLMLDGTYMELATADDMSSYALSHFAGIVNRWAHSSAASITDAGTYAYKEAFEEIEGISTEPFSLPSRLMFICAVHGLREAS